ncbi:thioredoxin-dependent thiol peroxidase [Paenibacillus chartarius]|uniref:thioredoxin-dependent peroxiredoxin n=1 Tax=Paenibacillus chartarius TaxID=747481 RepID=A0ABV6DTF3_9BACL
MSTLTAGEMAPDFTLPASNGEQITLSQYRGRKVVLFFYPQDLTPSCSNEACDFRDYTAEFRQLGVEVLGISPDDLKRHGKFVEKYTLPYPLLSDEGHRIAELFGVWGPKKLYGREYMGLIRSTFLIDEEGRIAKEWRNIKVKGHVQNVLDAVKAKKS